MPWLSFTFTNTNGSQAFTFDDMIDTSSNPHAVGPINSGATSSPQQCWDGGSGKGRISLSGSVGPTVYQDIPYDGYSFNY